MASDATNVYWTEFGDSSGSGNGSVKGCLVTGCGAGPTLYAQNLTTPRGIAVDATNVYFVALGGIYKCPLSGCCGGPGPVVSAFAPFGIALDATYIYWVDFGDNTAHRIPKAGGTDTVLYDASDGPVYEPFQLVADGPFLYFMDYNENAFRVSANGGSPAFLGSGNHGGGFGNCFGVTAESTEGHLLGNRGLLPGAMMGSV